MRPSSSTSSSSSPSSTPKSPYHHVIESKSISGDRSPPRLLAPTASTSSSAESPRDFPSLGFLDIFLQTLVTDDAFDSPTESFTSADVVPNARRRVFTFDPSDGASTFDPSDGASTFDPTKRRHTAGDLAQF